MAKLIARNVKLKVNGVDLSNMVQDIEFPWKWTNNIVTGMGSNFEERLLGIGDASLVVTFYANYASGQTDATLRPLAGSNTDFEVEVTPDSTLATGATNPRFVMRCVLDGYTPVKGKVGEASTMQVTFFNATQAGVLVYTT